MEPIKFSVTKDAGGNMYVVWTGKGRGLTFLKSGDLGKSWSEPMVISRAETYDSKYSGYVVVDSVLCAFPAPSGILS